MGKEAKIGLAVITVLLICFGVVLTKRLTGDRGDPQTASSEEHKDGARVHGEWEGKEADVPPLGHSARPTIVAAKNKSGQTGKGPRAEFGQYGGVSDETPGRHGGEASKGLPPSLMPNPRQGYPADPYDRYGSAYEGPQAGKGGEAEASDSDGVGQARDPFRGRTTAYPPSDAAPSGQSPNSLRLVDPSEVQQQPTRAGGYRPAGSGRSTGGYAPHDSTMKTPPGYGQDARYSPDWQRSMPEARHAGSSARFAAVSTAVSPTGGDGRRDDGTYEIQPNDSYWTISEKMYATGAYFKALAEHNRKKVPQEDRLQVGDVVSTPDVAELEKRYPDLCPKPSHREAVKKQPSTVSMHQYNTGRTYVTAEGDTLFDIARNELGKASRWSEIYDLNRDQIGPDYNYLRPGLQLVLPEGETSGKVTRRPGTEPSYRR